jgi:hypothetical protein
MAGAGVCAAQLTEFTRVVEIGDQVPGLAPGVVFEDFAVHPAIEGVFGLTSDPPARMGESGAISFHAFFGSDGVPDVPELEAPSGYFKVIDGSIELVTLTDAPAPGLPDPFGGPGIFPDTPYIGGGGAVTLSHFTGNPFNPAFGIWTDRSGSLEKVVAEGEQMVGLSPPASVDRPFPVARGQSLWIVADLFDEASPDVDPRGLWVDHGQGLSLVVKTELAAPGFEPGVVFGQTGSNPYGPLGFLGINADERFAITGWVKGANIDSSEDEGIWVEGEDGGLVLVMREGEKVPPGLLDQGATFESNGAETGAFSGPAHAPIQLNNDMDLAFTALVDFPGDKPRIPTLWTTRSGELELLAKGTAFFVAFSEPGDDAPGTEGTFHFFDQVRIDEEDVVALQAFVIVDEDDFFDPQLVGIWVDKGEGLEPVAIEGDPAPGVVGGTYFLPPGIGDPRGLGDLDLLPDGSILFAALVRQGNVLLDAIYRHEVDGTTVLIFREGGEVSVDGETRVVSSFRPFVRSGRSDEGEMAFELRFAGGASGIYTLDLGLACQADFNGDGALNILDFVAFQNAFTGGDESADCDGDGVLTILDFICFQDLFKGGC